MKTPWYEVLFADMANQYDQESFTQGTIKESDFIEQQIGFDKTVRILDIGCGTGRHSLELARRGYEVVGIDLSLGQINKAQEKAAALGINRVEFHCMDARNLPFQNAFDAVLILCEGGFCLMETDAENYQILAQAKRALKPHGYFICNALNVLYPLSHSMAQLDRLINASTTNFQQTHGELNLETFRLNSRIEFTDDNGTPFTIHSQERFYAPVEIRWMLTQLQFREINLYGCMPGQFSERPVTPHDFEMLVVAINQ